MEIHSAKYYVKYKKEQEAKDIENSNIYDCLTWFIYFAMKCF